MKARAALRKALQLEQDKWMKLDMARVLASLGDAAGKEVLVSAFKGEEIYGTSSSGIEISKAVLSLLLLNYDFPDGIPRFPVWGGLSDYFDAIRKESHKPKE